MTALKPQRPVSDRVAAWLGGVVAETRARSQGVGARVQRLLRSRTGAHHPEDDAAGEERPSTTTVRPSASDAVHRGIFLDPEEMKDRVRKALLVQAYNVTDYYKTTGVCQYLARSSTFENFCLLVIVVNAIWIAVDIDLNDANFLWEAKPVFVVMENCFCSWFTFEILVRFGAFRRTISAFKDYWFLFDGSLVLLMVWDTWVMSIIAKINGSGQSVGLKNVAILRILRLVRLARVARLLRSVPELMVLVKGMASALRSVFFVICLIVLALFLFGIMLKLAAEGTPTVGDKYFSSVLISMGQLACYGLFMDNVKDMTEDLGRESWWGLFLFASFVLLGSLTLMNMLIGVLCEVITVAAASEKEEITVNFVKDRVQEVLKTMEREPGSSTGGITKAEFLQLLQNAEIAAALEEVDIDPIGIVDFAGYIFDEKRVTGLDMRLSFDDFMTVLLTLRGSNTATVKDIVDLRRLVLNALYEVEMTLTTTRSAVLKQHLRGARRSKSDPEAPKKPSRRPGQPRSPRSPADSEPDAAEPRDIDQVHSHDGDRASDDHVGKQAAPSHEARHHSKVTFASENTHHQGGASESSGWAGAPSPKAHNRDQEALRAEFSHVLHLLEDKAQSVEEMLHALLEEVRGRPRSGAVSPEALSAKLQQLEETRSAGSLEIVNERPCWTGSTASSGPGLEDARKAATDDLHLLPGMLSAPPASTREADDLHLLPGMLRTPST